MAKRIRYDLNGTPERGGGKPTLRFRLIPQVLTTIDLTEIADLVTFREKFFTSNQRFGVGLNVLMSSNEQNIIRVSGVF